jgi:integrase
LVTTILGTENKTVDTFVNSVSIQNKNTALEYKKRLTHFSRYVNEVHGLSLDELIETLTIEGRGPQINVYDLFTRYIAWLHKKGTMSPRSIKTWVSTARSFLETYDVDISPRKWQLKVRVPRVGRTEKAALSKEDIQIILNACTSPRLKIYLLFLAATGCRANEPLSVRLGDINFEKEPPTINLRAEHTKTKVSRTLYLTRELSEQLKDFIRYKHRARSIGYYDKATKKTNNILKTPTVNKQLLLFAQYDKKNTLIGSIYTRLNVAFDKTLDRLGGKYAEYEDDTSRRRHKYTFHSFRRFVKSTISDLGYADFSEAYLGHAGSTYYRKTNKETIDLFRKCEPYLTFLDIAGLERRGADLETKIDSLQRENFELRTYAERMKKRDKELDELTSQFQDIRKKMGI